MEASGSNTIPSYLYRATVIVDNMDDLSPPRRMLVLCRYLCRRLGMKVLGGGPRMDRLPSRIFGIESWSINQPLKTSVISIDTWPDKLEHGAFIVLVHSCKPFMKSAASRAIRSFSRKWRTAGVRYSDDTYRARQIK